MKKFVKFPEIEQFRTIIKDVQHSSQYQGKDAEGNPIFDRNAIMPTLTFEGTVKLHGTNGAVCCDTSTGEIWAQKRSGICTVEQDNAGFAFFVHSKKEEFKYLFDCLDHAIGATAENTSGHSISVLYGEWCGGNIQKGVAVSQLEKMFVIFDVKIHEVDDSDSIWVPSRLWNQIFDNPNKIYNIYQFPYYTIDIDFNNPQLSQNKLVEITNLVEIQCPVGKFFGVSGIGEGVVWKHSSAKTGTIRFKVKGTEHSVSKVKTLASVDVEKLASIDKFADYAVTENRLNQGIEQVFISNGLEPDIKKIGDFLRWMMGDIVKEETDVMVENNLEPKTVSKVCSDRARRWFQNKYC